MGPRTPGPRARAKGPGRGGPVSREASSLAAPESLKSISFHASHLSRREFLREVSMGLLFPHTRIRVRVISKLCLIACYAFTPCFGVSLPSIVSLKNGKLLTIVSCIPFGILLPTEPDLRRGGHTRDRGVNPPVPRKLPPASIDPYGRNCGKNNGHHGTHVVETR